MHLSRFIKIYPFETRPGYRLFYSTRRAATLLLDDAVCNALESGTLSASLEESLSRLGFLVPNAEHELGEIVTLFERINETRSQCSAVVVLNLDCNLACTYCYEQTVKNRQYMTKAVADRLISFVRGQDFKRIKTVNLGFYGGEPVLSKDLIIYISEQLKRAGEESGFDYSFTLVTNGTLFTGKVAEKLVALGLKGVKITLDGPPDLHNAARPFRGGKGSFDRIVENLQETCELTHIEIGGNYTFETYKRFPLLLDHLLERGLTPDRVLMVKFDPVVSVPDGRGPAELGSGCVSMNEGWLGEASVFVREEILTRGYRTPKITPIACVIEHKDDIVLNVDGSLYKCPGMLGRKEFVIGTIQHGISDYGKTYGLDHWKNAECLECAYLPLCFGGCRFMNMIKTGSVSRVDCRKAYFDATLEAFIKQEIKYKDQLIGPGSKPSDRAITRGKS